MSDLLPEGSVAAVSPDRGHRFSKTPQPGILLVEGHGVEGDAHAGAFVKHRYRARRQHPGGYYGTGYCGRPYVYDYGYDEPYRWGGAYTTTYYTAPVSYGYRYRRVVQPAYAYYRGSYPVVRHRWHHHHW